MAAKKDSDTIHLRLAVGDLRATDFQQLKPGQAAELTAKLVTGSFDQRANLVGLMSEPSFARILTIALNEISPIDRKRILQTVGDTSVPQVQQVRSTLAAALESMIPSRLDETLRETILSRDSAALRELNNFLEARANAAASFVRSVTLDISVDDSILSQFLSAMSTASQASALQGLIKEPPNVVCDVFKRIGDAVYDAQKEALRVQLEQAMNSISEVVRNDLLMKLIIDPSGNRPTDRQVNKGQRLVSEYLERKGFEESQLFLKEQSPTEMQIWKVFLLQNIRNEELLRKFYDYFEQIDQTLTTTKKEINTPTDAIMVVNAIIKELPFSKLINPFASPERLLGEVFDRFMQSEQQVKQLTEKFQNDRPWFDSGKEKLRDRISHIFENKENELILALAPSDLKNVIKTYMHPPTDMAELKKFVKKLTPKLSARLARVVHLATMEVIAEIKVGSWKGDLLKGLSISGKGGRSFSVKIGDAKSEGGEATTNISSEISFTWTPAALVEGGRAREVNQLISELNGFMNDWIVQLNHMTPNQKSIFLEEMKDVVTLKFNI